MKIIKKIQQFDLKQYNKKLQADFFIKYMELGNLSYDFLENLIRSSFSIIENYLGKNILNTIYDMEIHPKNCSFSNNKLSANLILENIMHLNLVEILLDTQKIDITKDSHLQWGNKLYSCININPSDIKNIYVQLTCGQEQIEPLIVQTSWEMVRNMTYESKQKDYSKLLLNLRAFRNSGFLSIVS